MGKTLRTSGDYTIQAGDGYNSGSGSNTINLDSLNVSVTGNLTVGGTSTTVSTTNTTIEDNIIELNTGASANLNSAGIIIERGSAGDNAAILWKEDTDSFIFGTTTATAADKSGAISVNAGSLEVSNLTAGSVTTNEISANGSNAAITIASSGTGDINLDSGGDLIVDVDNADLILKDDGTEFGRLSRVTADFVVKSSAQDQDLIFKGNDGGSTITALTLDMSEGGEATFGAGITANSLTTNTITANGSNAGISIQPSGSGEVLLGALRLNGTTLDTDDSSAITIGEEVNFEGAVNLSGGDLVTGNNRITFNDQSSGTVSFLDFTVTQFSQTNNTVLSSVKSINFFLDSNGGDTGEAFRIYNNTNPDSSPTENTYIFKVDESGNLFVTGDTTMTGDLTATDITANSLTTNVISSNGSNADISIQPSGTGNLTLGAVKINGTTLSSDDSTKITIAEATDVTGTLFSRGNVFGVQTLTGSGSTEVINLTDTVTLLVTTGGSQAFSLADGVEGQIKIISMKTDGGSGIVTPANFVNGTNITFDDVQDTIVLMYQSTGWVVLARQNSLVS
tara:strand:- start:510 stop:2207 length:1698 start_codon:yes stop_codon:yes gene_type:complete